MKKYIWISTITCICTIWSGCGSRTSNVDKTLKENETLISKTENSQKSTEIKTDDQSYQKEEKADTAKENIAKTETQSNISESNTQKSNSEQNIKTEKIIEYFENGLKKSETERSENFSKLSQENEIIKKTLESVKSENQMLESQNITLKSLNRTLSSKKNTLEETNKKLLEEKKQKEINKSKQTERKSYPWWIWFIAGGLAVVILFLIWKYININLKFKI